MKTLISIILLLGGYPQYANCQNPELSGQYIFEIKGEVYSTFLFSPDSRFVFYESGDICEIYGEGTYKLLNNRLILSFDASKYSQSLKDGDRILQYGQLELKIAEIKKQKIRLECPIMGRMETYKRLRRILK